MKLTSSPVKSAAEELGIEVLQDRARSPELLRRVIDLAPDVAVVVAFGSILPTELLEAVPHGFVNLHFSLLPAYRGAAPVQRAIMAGEQVSGASIMELTEGMDEGPVIATREEPIAPDDTTATYGAKLADIGADMLVTVLPLYVEGAVEPSPQDDAKATYADKLSTEDARIDWSQPSDRIDALVRALDPEPGAWTTLNETRLKVFKVVPAGEEDLEPGRVIDTRAGLVVGTGDSAVLLEDVQPATKKRMRSSDLARGLHLDGDVRMGG
jgi:methionyl-tRNA formyltransferase